MSEKTKNPDNYIGKEGPDELDADVRNACKKAPGWLPEGLEVYDMVQGWYPTEPGYGMMVHRADGGTDAEGMLIPPAGMWVKAEAVRAFLANPENLLTLLGDEFTPRSMTEEEAAEDRYLMEPETAPISAEVTPVDGAITPQNREQATAIVSAMQQGGTIAALDKGRSDIDPL